MSTSDHTLTHDGQAIRIIYLMGVIALLVVCCLVLLGRLVVDVERLHPRIIAALEKVTGRTVSSEGIHFSPTEGFFALELRNLQIHSQTDSEPPLLIAKKVQIGLAPFSFFYHGLDEEAPVEISSLTLFSPQLQIVRQEEEWLVQQLQEMLVRSDVQMKQHFGWGMTQLAVNSIKIQNGIVSLLNWEQASSQAIIVDRIYGEIHALSAEKASPVSFSARFHAIPFTLTGQVGPMPESLDLTALPVLLNLEAKSTGLMQFIDYFVNFVSLFASPLQKFSLPEQWEIGGARGYFFTLFNGSLKKGIQTRSRLELDKLVLTHKRESGRAEAQSRFAGGNHFRTEWGMGKEPLPVDIAFRQKSVMKLAEDENRPSFWLEEGFLYADGRPLLDIKGVWRGVGNDENEASSVLNMKVATLSGFDLRRFAAVLEPYISGETPQGELRLEGEWPNALHWSGHLDFTHTDLSWKGGNPLPTQATQQRSQRRQGSAWYSLFSLSGVDKRAGVPLLIDWEMVHERAEEMEDIWTIKELTLSRPPATSEPAESRVRLFGSLQPQLALDVTGEWELASLREYLHLASNWQIAGRMQMDLQLRGDGVRVNNREERGWLQDISGQLHVDSGQLAGITVQDLALRLKLEQGLLRLYDIEANAGMGRVQAQAWLESAGSERAAESEAAAYHAIFSFAGVALEKLSGSKQGGYVGLSPFAHQGRKGAGATATSRPVASKTAPWRPLIEGIAFGHGEIWGALNEQWLAVAPYSGNLQLQVESGRWSGINGDLLLRPPGDPQRIFSLDKGEVQEETGQEKGMTRDAAPFAKPFYWDRLHADMRWDQERIYFNPVFVQAGGLRITGSGERRASGQHGFDLVISSPLREDTEPYRARLEGDQQQTLYRLDKAMP
ncbi:hypothetical protein [Candidatus Magnetaquicoccus inordinatus]|uniref:hypothetical protein n=1 Tax=Candidatus Magnetaquicoccus inordinatus TaxID=2496818 RepID=UPI00102AAA46|nr:hypothetical protein [Candidatus Magnetaquicoccus inordinatus]